MSTVEGSVAVAGVSIDIRRSTIDNRPVKFGRIKKQHGRVGGLDEILRRIVTECPHVTRIVPGRIKVRRGKTPACFKVQYPTDAGLKCLYTGTGTVQEVFLICSDAAQAQEWLTTQKLI